MVNLLQEIIDKENLELDSKKLQQISDYIKKTFCDKLDMTMLEYIKNIEEDDFELYLHKLEEIKKYNNFLKEKLV